MIRCVPTCTLQKGLQSTLLWPLVSTQDDNQAWLPLENTAGEAGKLLLEKC